MQNTFQVSTVIHVVTRSTTYIFKWSCYFENHTIYYETAIQREMLAEYPTNLFLSCHYIIKFKLASGKLSWKTLSVFQKHRLQSHTQHTLHIDIFRTPETTRHMQYGVYNLAFIILPLVSVHTNDALLFQKRQRVKTAPLCPPSVVDIYI